MSTTQVGQGLEAQGVQTSKPVHFNLSAASLYEHAIRRHEGLLAQEGPLVCRTGAHTGRSPNDKFVVKEPSSEAQVWWGKVNKAIDLAHFDLLRRDIINHLKTQELFVQDLYAGADPEYRLPVRFIHELAWQNLFVRNLFIVPPAADLAGFQPQFTVMTAPSFKSDPARHGTRSDVTIAVNLASREILICGSSYAGENKKSIFTVLNYLLPLRDVLSMHCSANMGPAGDTALFFGLSGTGKTTLSSDPDRQLIGDDEHGWSDRGVFNFEGGCYAKTIRLSAEAEPQIYATTRRFGTVLENVVMDPATRLLNLDDASLTENTRAAYPIEFIDNAVPSGTGGHPKNIVMLTADAYGVLAADRASVAGRRDVSLPLGLHRQGGGHREGRDRTERDLQHLFRRAVPAAQSERLRKAARRADRQVRLARVAREHRLDRRTARCRQPNEDRLYACDGSCRVVGPAG
jgi:phosphoenolpyruvate carboxykinase (ATP)